MHYSKTYCLHICLSVSMSLCNCPFNSENLGYFFNLCTIGWLIPNEHNYVLWYCHFNFHARSASLCFLCQKVTIVTLIGLKFWALHGSHTEVFLVRIQLSKEVEYDRLYECSTHEIFVIFIQLLFLSGHLGPCKLPRSSSLIVVFLYL